MYYVANCLKTIVEHQEENRQYFKCRQTPSPSFFDVGTLGIFTLTTTVNSTTSMMKDRFYARNFGVITAKMPSITYCLWGLRDCMVIGSSFILPEYMCNSLQEQTDFMDRKTALQFSQIACPILAQVVATPAQMLGLDFYNRPLADLSYKAAAVERTKFQYINFTSILGARIARILPSYGIGGVGNTYFRDMWRDYVHEKYLNGYGLKFELK